MQKNTLMKLATSDSMHNFFEDQARVYNQSIKQFSNREKGNARNLQEQYGFCIPLYVQAHVKTNQVRVYNQSIKQFSNMIR